MMMPQTKRAYFMPSHSPTLRPQALLFDLGGVLIDVDFNRAIEVWAPYSSLSVNDLMRTLAVDVAYQQHERGEITAAKYFNHLAATLKLDATLAEIEQGWNAIFIGEITEARLLVESVCATIPCYSFTNTNATHTAIWRAQFPQITRLFERIFTSHEMGLRKPERAAFEHIVQSTGIPASSILFFDDLLENVEGAKDAGLQSVLVRSPADIASSLRGFRLSSHTFFGQDFLDCC